MKSLSALSSRTRRLVQVFLWVLAIGIVLHMSTTFLIHIFSTAVSSSSEDDDTWWKDSISQYQMNSSIDDVIKTFRTNKKYMKRSKLIVNTTGCTIPRTPIFPDYLKRKWLFASKAKTPDCSYAKSMTTLRDDGFLELHDEYKTSECCLHEVLRLDNNDNGFDLSPCQRFTAIEDVRKKEILLTKCGNTGAFDVNLPVTPQVQMKLDFWKNVSIDDLPPNIIFFGIDTVSRSHAFRSLPKTLKLMKRMGFSDFKGYHSIEHSTLTSFMGLLFGMPRTQVRRECAPDWTSSFDSCPLIWKEFSLQNYVTMFIEDGAQTFNWGGQSGFRVKPTDYYVHPLFGAIRGFRRVYSKVKEENIGCTSNETVPDFIFRYTSNFAQKFQFQAPFFSFTWLTNPFHGNEHALRSYDNDIRHLFENLLTLPTEHNTLIFFISDHGARMRTTESKLAGFLEKSLPSLFVRFPSKLRKNFPDLEAAVEANTKALITPFDLHHTLKHILYVNQQFDIYKRNATNSSNLGAYHFNITMDDRISLFTSAPGTRTCEMLNILLQYCVCGISTDLAPTTRYDLAAAMDFVIGKLNEVLSTSKYNELCAEWKSVSDDSVILHQPLRTNQNYTDSLIQFRVSPSNSVSHDEIAVAAFQIILRVLHFNSKFELVGKFSRIDAYGNESYCTPFINDYDKEMKAFCFCKHLLKWAG